MPGNYNFWLETINRVICQSESVCGEGSGYSHALAGSESGSLLTDVNHT